MRAFRRFIVHRLAPAEPARLARRPRPQPKVAARRRCLDRAEHEIDMAAYVLTDSPVMQALTRAADRGVAIRIYLDGTQLAEREPTKVFNDLAETPGVEIRIKHKARDPMHLKSYQIDGKWLRTGAANFSASGLKRQDNDLIVIESAEAASAFKRTFDALFASGEALSAEAR
jgi:phosphatidylserine/phosphatidylglycerophosphate/cardiolipin synthase-like enzyme